MSPLASTVAAWLTTYLIHSSIFLSAAWLVGRSGRAPHWLQERAWRLAIVAGLVSASLQLGAGLEPVSGSFKLAEPMRGQATTAMAEIASSAAPALSASELASGLTVGEPAEAPAGDGTVAATPAPQPSASSTGNAWPLAAMLWLVGLVVFGFRYARAGWRLRAVLRGRRRLAVGPVVGLVDELAPAAAGVRVSVSDALPVPIVFGILRPEICLPERVLTELGREEQRSIVAHEVAHLRRRDPLWRLLSAAIEALLFFQPLNRLARHRMQTLSEYLSDDWAVARTERPLALARCLTEVAGWGPVPGAQIAPSMASRHSTLSNRVRRLLDGSRRCHRAPRRAGMLAASLALIALAACTAPGVAVPAGDQAEQAKKDTMRQRLDEAIVACARVEEIAQEADDSGSREPAIGPLEDPYEMPTDEVFGVGRPQRPARAKRGAKARQGKAKRHRKSHKKLRKGAKRLKKRQAKLAKKLGKLHNKLGKLQQRRPKAGKLDQRDKKLAKLNGRKAKLTKRLQRLNQKLRERSKVRKPKGQRAGKRRGNEDRRARRKARAAKRKARAAKRRGRQRELDELEQTPQ